MFTRLSSADFLVHLETQSLEFGDKEVDNEPLLITGDIVKVLILFHR